MRHHRYNKRRKRHTSCASKHQRDSETSSSWYKVARTGSWHTIGTATMPLLRKGHEKTTKNESSRWWLRNGQDEPIKEPKTSYAQLPYEYLQWMKESGSAKDAMAYMQTSGRLPTTNEYDGSFAIRSNIDWGEEPDGPLSRWLLPKARLRKQEELACPHDKKERRRTKDERRAYDRSTKVDYNWDLRWLIDAKEEVICKLRLLGGYGMECMATYWKRTEPTANKRAYLPYSFARIAVGLCRIRWGRPDSPRLTHCFRNVFDKMS